jgi:hypothetical protein
VPSLIQQRMAIDRQRIIALVMSGLAVLYLGLTVFILISSLGSPPPSLLLNGTLSVVWTAGGVWSYLDARKKLRAFEAEHGVGAGKQKPVR